MNVVKRTNLRGLGGGRGDRGGRGGTLISLAAVVAHGVTRIYASTTVVMIVR